MQGTHDGSARVWLSLTESCVLFMYLMYEYTWPLLLHARPRADYLPNTYVLFLHAGAKAPLVITNTLMPLGSLCLFNYA